MRFTETELEETSSDSAPHCHIIISYDLFLKKNKSVNHPLELGMFWNRLVENLIPLNITNF